MVRKSVAIEIEISYHDVDAMQIAWHGHYYKYFEIARTALLRSFSYDIWEMLDSGYQWPITESHCRHHAPLQYGMKVKVIATIREYKHRLKISYRIVDVNNEQLLAKGYTVQVAVKISSQKMCFNSPGILLNRLGIQK